jgi:hypothetical protein
MDESQQNLEQTVPLAVTTDTAPPAQPATFVPPEQPVQPPTAMPPVQPGQSATPPPRTGVGGGMATCLVILALAIGLIGGLMLGLAGGFVAGRGVEGGEITIPVLRAVVVLPTREPAANPGLTGRAPAAGQALPGQIVPQAPVATPAPPRAGGGLQIIPVTPGPWLGVYIQDVSAPASGTPSGSLQTGAVVTQVVSNSPAEAAGLKVGDIVTAVDDTPIATAKEMSAAVAKAKIGQTIKLRVVRDGAEQTVPVTLGSRSATSAGAASGLPDLRSLQLDPNDPEVQQMLQQLPPEVRQRIEEMMQSGTLATPTPAQPTPGA